MGIFEHHTKDIELVYDRYADLMYRLAFSHLQNSHDAQDAIQDTFIKYMTSAPVFKNSEHEKAWMIRVLTNRCTDILRRKKVRSYVPLEEVEYMHSDDTIEKNDALQTLNSMLSSIPDKAKSIFILHYLEGYSVKETANILGISLSAAKMRLARGREALLGLLRKEDHNVQ